MKHKLKKITKKIGPKKLLLIAIVILLLAVLLTFLTQNQEKYTFEKGFNEIKQLDEKYNTDFKKEDVNGTIINYKNIDPYLEDLKNLREKVEKSLDENPTDEEKAFITLIDARTLMLLSQKNYHQASIYGDRGLVTDEKGFSCSESGYIINTAYYYNLSWASGVQAYLALDQLLDIYRDVPKVWELVGINDEKPAFFYAPIGELKIEMRNNLFALENFCFINMSRGLTNPVDPEIYAELPTDKDLIQKQIDSQIPPNITWGDATYYPA